MVNESGERNPSDDALNELLQQLVTEAQKYRHKSIQRRIALNKVIRAIQQSGKLSKQINWTGLANYQDFYNEALQQTLLEICENIENYNPQYPVMSWVNQIFNWRFSDLVKKYQKRGITNLPKTQKLPQVLAINDLNSEVLEEKNVYEDERHLREVIENDPESFLENEVIKNYEYVNLKIIILMLLEGKRWKDISAELGIPLSTGSSFYQRRLHKVIPYLQKYL